MTPLLFLLTFILLSCSCLTVLSAPTAPQLVSAILIAEWGHWFALLAFALAALSWRRGKLGRITAALALLSALFALRPLMDASRIAQTLPARCTAAFGTPAESGGRTHPFRLLDLVRVVPVDDVQVSEHVYATEGAKELKLDLYRSKRARQCKGLVVIIHGGSWNRGSKEQLPAINRYLAGEGYAVAALNYRHAPKFPFPAAVEDVFRALAFLKAHAAELQIETPGIVLMGRSAGGQIALSAGYAEREPAIRGVIAFYPPTDLVMGYDNPSARWVLDSKKVLEDYLGGTPAEKPNEYRAASPVNFITSATPPTLLIHGALDSVVWPAHSELLERRLRETGRPHLQLSLGWATHGCDANLSGPSGQLSLYAIERFLAAVFGSWWIERSELDANATGEAANFKMER